jgi:hypothetical protein
MPTDKLTPAMHAVLRRVAAGGTPYGEYAEKPRAYVRAAAHQCHDSGLIAKDDAGGQWHVTEAGRAALAQQEKPNA